MIIKGKDDMAAIVEKYGFLPFFSSSIPGFSVEELSSPEVWFPPKGEGVWEWKDDVISMTGGAYGRFFHSRPAFVSREFFTLLAAYRRDGYDYEGFSGDGHATRSERTVYEKLEETDSEVSTYLRLQTKLSRSTFDKAVAGLQMQTFAVISGFDYKRSKDGRNYGWGLARYALADTFFGPDFEDDIDRYLPEDAYEALIDHILSRFSGCDRSDAVRLLGHR